MNGKLIRSIWLVFGLLLGLIFYFVIVLLAEDIYHVNLPWFWN